MSLTAWIVTIMAAMLGGLTVIVAGHRPRPCRRCHGVGSARGRGGRWAGRCTRCRGSGQVDSWTTRVLVAVTRGRVLPRTGSATEGHLNGQAPVLDGRAPDGRPRWRPDPADSRLVALEQRRVPTRQRVLERREAQRASARGPALLVALVRVWIARVALRRAQRAAEDHRDLLDARAGGYRALAGTGRDRRRRGVAQPGGPAPTRPRAPRPSSARRSR